MQKIGYFIDSHDPGGAETVVVALADAVRSRGFEPEVYHFGNPWLEARCRSLGVTTVTAPGRRSFSSVLRLPVFAAIFARFLRQRRVSLLHSHLFGAVTAGALAARLAGLPHVGTLHDWYTLAERPARIRFLQVAAYLGTRIVAVSRDLKQRIAAAGPIAASRVQVVPNGIDLDRFSSRRNGLRRAELTVKDDELLFISVGRLERVKGYDLLIEAFGRAQLSAPAKLLIVGDGSCRAEIEATVRERGLGGRVLLPGHRDDISQLLALSDSFALFSRSEGLSCSIIEAMAAGLPIMASDVGGNRELVESGANGLLLPAGDVDACAAAFGRLAADSGLRLRYGSESRRRARERFSLEAMVERYLEVYAEAGCIAANITADDKTGQKAQYQSKIFTAEDAE